MRGFLLLAALCLVSAVCIDAGKVAKKPPMTLELTNQLKIASRFFAGNPVTAQRGVPSTEVKRAFTTKVGARDMPVGCAVCTIAVSEVWGQLQENHTVAFIQQELTQDVCSLLSGVAETACDEFVTLLPEIADMLESRDDVADVCQKFGFCAAPYGNHSDPMAIPHVTVNLDLPYEQRLTHLCSNQTLTAGVLYVVATLRALLPGNGNELSVLGEYIHSTFPPEYAGEIAGCATAAGGELTVGWISIFNLGYEVSDACTSTVVTDSASGTPLHGRNLDFFTGGGFTDSLKESAMQVDYQSGGKTLYTISQFPGYVGALSIMKAGVASVTIDTRFSAAGIEFIFYEIIEFLEEKNASMVSFLSRWAVESSSTWAETVSKLSNTPITAYVYFISAGPDAGNGVVIARNPNATARTWYLNGKDALTSPSGPFILETNYDWWGPVPWFDDRRDPGYAHVRQVPKGGMNRDALWTVMSTKPTFNAQTTWTNILQPSTGHYETFARWCNLDSGCVQ